MVKITVVALISILLVGTILYWLIPYSPLRSAFERAHETLDTDLVQKNTTDTLTTQDIAHLPSAVQQFFIKNGFVGSPRYQAMKMVQRDVPFKQNKDRALTITYTQYNYASKIARIARIDSSLFGIPFDGFDYLHENDARMTGQAAKMVTVFDHHSNDLLQGALVTYLSEALLLPDAALRKDITWEEIDEQHVRATLTHGSLKVSGVFAFNDAFEMTSFKTERRGMMQDDGTARYLPWTITAGDYRVENGHNVPHSLQAIWNYPEGDLMYFDSDNVEIRYY